MTRLEPWDFEEPASRIWRCVNLRQRRSEAIPPLVQATTALAPGGAHPLGEGLSSHRSPDSQLIFPEARWRIAVRICRYPTRRRNADPALEGRASCAKENISHRFGAPDEYEEYQHLLFEHRDDGNPAITSTAPRSHATNNACTGIERVWKDTRRRPRDRVVVITAKGARFGRGDLEMIERMAGSAANIGQAWREAGDIVYNMINLDKPIIWRINGVAVGAGLRSGLHGRTSRSPPRTCASPMAISAGGGRGDHAVIICRLLCGMARPSTIC